MATFCFLDFETYSEADIKKVGASLYLEDASTEILCVGFRYMNEDWLIKNLYAPDENDQAAILMLMRLAENDTIIFVAHNAPFEIKAWKEHMEPEGFPPIALERWRCTMAQCLNMGLAGKLELAAKTMRLPQQKGSSKAMLKLSKPIQKNWRGKYGGRIRYEYSDCPDDFEELYVYCIQDNLTAENLFNELRPLSQRELDIWRLDCAINQRGIKVDVSTVHKAIGIVSSMKAVALVDFQTATGGELDTPNRRQKLVSWCRDAGVNINDSTAPTIRKLLAVESTPAEVRRVLEITQGLSRSSVTKYQAFLDRANSEGIVRDFLFYHGAHTSRWTMRKPQFHNMRRPFIDIGLATEMLQRYGFDMFSFYYPDIQDTISQCTRAMIIPREGNQFYVGDYSSIESVGLAWLAGAQDKLDDFAEVFADESGKLPDMYCRIATPTFNRPITKADKIERQVGKVQELACGYEGGINSFKTFADIYGVDLEILFPLVWPTTTPDERDKALFSAERYFREARAFGLEVISRNAALACDVMKQRWRVSNPLIVQFWKDLKNGAMQAVETGKPVTVGKLVFFMHKQFLFCRVPSGKCLAYPFPVVRSSKFGPAFGYYSADPKKGGMHMTYGGAIAQNIVECICREKLVDSHFNLSRAGYDLAFHVHDENACEVPIGFGTLEEFKYLMEKTEDWGAGWPVKVNAWQGLRYGKE